MRPAASALGLVLLLVGTASARPAAFYPQGTLSFSYRQIPIGLTGNFLSSGNVMDRSAFPVDGSGATTALYTEADGIAYLLVAGGIRNADRSVDAAFLFLSGPAPLTPGSFVIDSAGRRAMFGFVDDAMGVTLPDDLTTMDLGKWVRSLEASRKFLSTVGYLTLTQADPGALQGMFSLTATDLSSGLQVLVPDGIFSLGTTVSLNSESWGSIKSGYGE